MNHVCSKFTSYNQDSKSVRFYRPTLVVEITLRPFFDVVVTISPIQLVTPRMPSRDQGDFAQSVQPSQGCAAGRTSN